VVPELPVVTRMPVARAVTPVTRRPATTPVRAVAPDPAIAWVRNYI
jgi:hypothetical protein